MCTRATSHVVQNAMQESSCWSACECHESLRTDTSLVMLVIPVETTRKATPFKHYNDISNTWLTHYQLSHATQGTLAD